MRVAACNGALPFDEAFSADNEFILAWLVAKGENSGLTFDWERMVWIERG